MLASGAHRVADAAVGIVGTLEEGTVGFDERFEERQRGGGILRQQLAIDLVQPGLQRAPELARLAVGEELGRAAPSGQRLAKPGGELVGPVGQLQSLQATSYRFVVLGEFKKNRDQGRWVLPLQGFLVAVAGTVVAAYFLRQSSRSATEDQHIRGTTLAPPDVVLALAKASHLPYDFTLAGIPLFREAETDCP